MLKLPEYVIVCPVCKGEGRYDQTYNSGCGIGNYISSGPCVLCSDRKDFHRNIYRGVGFIYEPTSVPVGKSVIEQIRTMNPKEKIHGGEYTPY